MYMMLATGNAWIFIIVLLFLISTVEFVTSLASYRKLSACPNGCSGQGICVSNACSSDACVNASITAASGECSCFAGFVGADCSQRMCAAGVAWVDFPSANNTARSNYTECSNMGRCNRATGKCECRFGFSGAACNTMVCPMGPQINCVVSTRYRYCGNNAVCSGHGKCMSLRHASAWKDYNTLFDSTQYTGWDADMIHGCVCDDGWEGPNCDKKICPKGDNPSTTEQVDEIQLLDCRCRRCGGGLYLTINGKSTGYIPYTAKEAVVRHMIDKLDVLESYDLKIMDGKAICSSSGSTMKLTFHVPSGPQDAMIVTTTSTLQGDINVLTGRKRSQFYTYLQARKGNKEYETCSGQGLCNTTSGSCMCYSRYTSSDGRGNIGSRGDCGYEKYSFEPVWLANGQLANITCAVIDGEVCSGHGHCEGGNKISPYSYCVCEHGWTGEACNYNLCKATKSWFGDVGTSHSLTAVCSGVGTCNYDTGTCYDCGGPLGLFDGDNCEKLACPIDNSGNICSGNGKCLSMRQMAQQTWSSQDVIEPYEYTTEWDADMIRGCACERAVPYKLKYLNYYKDPVEHYDYTIPDTQDYFNTTYDIRQHKYDNYTVVNRIYNTKFYRGPFGNSVTDFKGYACSQAYCPVGDDPHTVGQLNEVQILDCRATNGTFFLTFRGSRTADIEWNTTIATFKLYLEAVPKINKVRVWAAVHEFNTELPICEYGGNRTIYIEFLSPHGDLPLLLVDSTNLELGTVHQPNNMINITEYQAGTTEELECSSRGLCDEDTGICQCLQGYASSNGTIDFVGSSGDCSYFNKYYRPDMSAVEVEIEQYNFRSGQTSL